jgi:undecaprenyl phosphate-alpha-L-ara4N flippase subunit ArnE
MAWWLYVLTVALTCAGQLLQKRAAQAWVRTGGGVRALLARPALWAACSCLGLGAVCWLALLQRWPVGRAYALLSVNFVVMLLVARFAFHERVGARHWLGVALIVGGIALLQSG